MPPGLGDGPEAPGPSPAKLSAARVCCLVVSTTSFDPSPDVLLTTDKQIKSQVSEMMQIPCQPWEAMKHLGNQQGCDVTWRNAGLAGNCVT